jgi:hypothetical protein
MDARFLAIMFNVTLLQQGYEGWKICSEVKRGKNPARVFCITQV